MVLAELIGDLLPPGVLNVVTGPGSDAGKALATSKRIRKIAFTGETTTGRQIAEYASKNLIPATLELGGKSPNVFFADVADKNDKFYDKALEGITLYAFNSGEVCTCPSRALVQDSFYDSFMADAVARTEKILMGNPLDTNTQMGAQVSKGQMETILGYIEIGKKEGATVLTGGARAVLDGDLAGGFYIKPTILAGTNDMRVFQEEIFGPVLAVARFTDYDDAISIANDTVFGLGAGVWSRNGNTTYRAGLDVAAGAVGRVAVARPDACAQTEDGVVGNRDRVVVVRETGHREHRAEDLLLEDPHVVGASQDRRLDVEAFGQIAVEHRPGAAGEDCGPLLLTDLDVAEDRFHLSLADLGAHLGVRVQRVAHDDLLG